MTAPNIVNVATITAKTASAALGTSAASIVSNAASSNKVFKINTLLISNVDGSNSADATVYLNDGASGGGSTDRAIVSTVLVPSDSTLVVIDGNSKLYLEENTSITALASAAGDLEIIISYEEIS